jgi:transposase
VGGKVQVLETVKDETARPKGAPTENFIVDIVTTAATASDLAGMEQVLESQKAQGRPAPSELLVDAAYVSAETLAEAKTEGRELLGPPLSAPPKEGVIPAYAFTIDLEHRTATCPAGHASTKCGHIHDAHQKTVYYRFSWGRQCASCPRRPECTTSQERSVSVGEHHAALEERRRQMKDPEFVKRLQARGGMRRTRYRGRTKWERGNLMHVAACNVKRWLRLLAWRMKQATVAAAAA